MSVSSNGTPRPARSPPASSSSAQPTQHKPAAAAVATTYPYKRVCAPGEAPSWEVVLYALLQLEHGAQVLGLVKAAEASARKSRRDIAAAIQRPLPLRAAAGAARGQPVEGRAGCALRAAGAGAAAESSVERAGEGR